jgi:HEAT repeat protein
VQGVDPLPQIGAQAPQRRDELLGLAAALFNEDARIRTQAAHTLGQLGVAAAQHPAVLPSLVQVALHDQDGGVRARAVDALGQVGVTSDGSARILPALIQVIQRDRDARMCARAARALGQAGQATAPHPQVLSVLLSALHDEDSNVRAETAEVLGELMAQGVRIFRHWWRRVEVKSAEDLATVRK